MKNVNYFFVVFTYLICFSLIRCSNGSNGPVISHDFFFPSECKGGIDGNWVYLCRVTVTGAITERKEKPIQVYIRDRKGYLLLKDKFTVVGKHIESIGSWKDFERLEITLLDQDLDLTGDTLRIIKSSVVKNLHYVYNSNKKKFYKEDN